MTPQDIIAGLRLKQASYQGVADGLDPNSDWERGLYSEWVEKTELMREAADFIEMVLRSWGTI